MCCSQQYLIKWKGYPSSKNLWVSAKDMHTPEILEEYLDSKKSAASTTVSRTYKRQPKILQSPHQSADTWFPFNYRPLHPILHSCLISLHRCSTARHPRSSRRTQASLPMLPPVHQAARPKNPSSSTPAPIGFTVDIPFAVTTTNTRHVPPFRTPYTHPFPS